MKTWLKRFLLIAAALLVLAFLALEILRIVGTRSGVESVVLPIGSEIAARSDSSDYSDAYRIPIPKSMSPQDLIAYLSQSGGGGIEIHEVVRAQNEVVYEGCAPGVRFLVSYFLSPGPDSTHLTVSTSVFYESLLGAIYFMVVKEVHRRVLPFLLSRLLRSLKQESQSPRSTVASSRPSVRWA